MSQSARVGALHSCDREQRAVHTHGTGSQGGLGLGDLGGVTELGTHWAHVLTGSEGTTADSRSLHVLVSHLSKNPEGPVTTNWTQRGFPTSCHLLVGPSGKVGGGWRRRRHVLPVSPPHSAGRPDLSLRGKRCRDWVAPCL